MTKRTVELNDTEAWLIQTVIRPMLSDPLWHGEAVIKVQAGQVVHVNRGEGMKPPERVGMRRVVG
ncbi:MAG: hypothetical protein WA003_15615 [Desulfuromonadaceae bacterium]